MSKFEMYPDKAGKYRWRLKAGNGETIAQGQGYSSKQACEKGIDAVKREAPNAEVVEVEN